MNDFAIQYSPMQGHYIGHIPSYLSIIRMFVLALIFPCPLFGYKIDTIMLPNGCTKRLTLSICTRTILSDSLSYSLLQKQFLPSPVFVHYEFIISGFTPHPSSHRISTKLISLARSFLVAQHPILYNSSCLIVDIVDNRNQ